MIIGSFYLSEDGALERLIDLTELYSDEIEEIVGRFRSSHYRFAGLLKGEVIEYVTGEIKIRHHFSKKILWEE